MSATERAYSTPEPDYRLAPGVETLKVKVRCACGTFARNLRGIREGIEFLRRAQPPPNLPVESYWCGVCKETVVITARQLGLSV